MRSTNILDDQSKSLLVKEPMFFRPLKLLAVGAPQRPHDAPHLTDVTHSAICTLNFIMIRTVALIALVGSASAAAADYKTAEVGCTNAYSAVTCDHYLTEATCNADPVCLYVSEGDDNYCGLTADEEVTWDVDSSAADTALQTAINTCNALDNTAAACTGDCAPGSENDGCMPTATKATTLLTADGANAGIKGYYAAEATSSATCGIHATEAACTAVAGCEFQTLVVDGVTQGSRCKTTNLVKVTSIKALCADNGATSYATAAATAVSGADVAAPLMVVLSTLVAALAIFA